MDIGGTTMNQTQPNPTNAPRWEPPSFADDWKPLPAIDGRRCPICGGAITLEYEADRHNPDVWVCVNCQADAAERRTA